MDKNFVKNLSTVETQITEVLETFAHIHGLGRAGVVAGVLRIHFASEQALSIIALLGSLREDQGKQAEQAIGALNREFSQGMELILSEALKDWPQELRGEAGKLIDTSLTRLRQLHNKG